MNLGTYVFFPSMCLCLSTSIKEEHRFPDVLDSSLTIYCICFLLGHCVMISIWREGRSDFLLLILCILQLELWFICFISFHVALLLLTLVSRKNINFQVYEGNMALCYQFHLGFEWFHQVCFRAAAEEARRNKEVRSLAESTRL